MYGPAYPKIQTLWKRRPDTHVVIPGDYARPEIEALELAKWVWTEKIDGTNTRLYYNGSSVHIGGRTDNAQWNPHVLSFLEGVANPYAFEHVYGRKHVVLYGETFGPGIQKGGGYGPKLMFRAFDLRVGTESGITANSPFTGRVKVAEMADALGVPAVDILGVQTLYGAWHKLLDRAWESTFPEHELEGIVGRPEVPFYVASNEALTPVMVKMKYADLKGLE